MEAIFTSDQDFLLALKSLNNTNLFLVRLPLPPSLTSFNVSEVFFAFDESTTVVGQIAVLCPTCFCLILLFSEIVEETLLVK